jgi:hypothetical protein
MGGAVFVGGAAQEVSLCAGAVSMQDLSVSFTDCLFKNNAANGASKSPHATIHTLTLELTYTRSLTTLLPCPSPLAAGGALYVGYTVKGAPPCWAASNILVHLVSTTLHGNRAGFFGGESWGLVGGAGVQAFFPEGPVGSANTVQLVLEDSEVSNNSAAMPHCALCNGGGLLLQNVGLTLNNSIVLNNNASSVGGGVYSALGTASFSSLGSAISDNSALSGEQVYWAGSGALELTRTTIIAGSSLSEVVITGSTSIAMSQSMVQCPLGTVLVGAPFLTTVKQYIPGNDDEKIWPRDLSEATLGCNACDAFSYTVQASWTTNLDINGTTQPVCLDCPVGALCGLADGRPLPAADYWGSLTTTSDTKASLSCMYVQCPEEFCSPSNTSEHDAAATWIRSTGKRRAAPGRWGSTKPEHGSGSAPEVSPCGTSEDMCTETRTGILCSSCVDDHGQAFGTTVCRPKRGCLSTPVDYAALAVFMAVVAVVGRQLGREGRQHEHPKGTVTGYVHGQHQESTNDSAEADQETGSVTSVASSHGGGPNAPNVANSEGSIRGHGGHRRPRQRRQVAQATISAPGQSRLAQCGLPVPLHRCLSVLFLLANQVLDQARRALTQLPLRYALFFYQMAPTALGGTAPLSPPRMDTLLGLMGFSTDAAAWSGTGAREFKAGDSGVCVFGGLSALGRVLSAYILPISILVAAVTYPSIVALAPKAPSVKTMAKASGLLYWFFAETTFRVVHCVSVSSRSCVQGGDCRLYEAADEVRCVAGWQVPFVVFAVVLVLLPVVVLVYVVVTPHTKWSAFVEGVMEEAGNNPTRPVWVAPTAILLRVGVAAAGVFLRTLPVGRSVILASIFIAFVTMQVWARGTSSASTTVDDRQHSFETVTLALLAVLATMNVPTATLIQVPNVNVDDNSSNGSLLFRRAAATTCLAAPVLYLIILHVTGQRRCACTRPTCSTWGLPSLRCRRGQASSAGHRCDPSELTPLVGNHHISDPSPTQAAVAGWCPCPYPCRRRLRRAGAGGPAADPVR